MTSLQGKRAVIAGLVTACAVAVAGVASLSNALGKQPVIVAKGIPEGPTNSVGSSLPANTVSGCWEVALAGNALSAHWLTACDRAGPAPLGDQPWPDGTLRLPATAGVELVMAQVDVHAILSEELAERGTGALLFLPASASGAGYYVAAWTKPSDADNADGAELVGRGIKVGLYGGAPYSVVTPAGRVYLTPEFSPRRTLAPGAGEEAESTEALTVSTPLSPNVAVDLGRSPAAEPDQHAGQQEQQ